MAKLGSLLIEYGFDADEVVFRETIADVFAEMCPGMTDEDLLCDPELAIRFDNAVRKKVGNRKIPNTLINRTLTNMRKNSSISVE